MSANPTGPLSVGHGRQAVLGDCIARLLEAAGWKVTREYYFNNGGRQMRVLGESVKARYLELLGRAAPPPKEALEDANLPWPEAIGGKPVLFPRDGYQGDYIVEIAEAIRAREGEGWASSRATAASRRRPRRRSSPASRPRSSCSASASTSTTTRRRSTRRRRSRPCSRTCAPRARSTTRTARCGCARWSSGSSATACS